MGASRTAVSLESLRLAAMRSRAKQRTSSQTTTPPPAAPPVRQNEKFAESDEKPAVTAKVSSPSTNEQECEFDISVCDIAYLGLLTKKLFLNEKTLLACQLGVHIISDCSVLVGEH